jgi:hypothetical protein
MLKGFWDFGPANFAATAATLWHWIGANPVQLLLAIFFLQGICTLWLALHAHALTRHLRRVSRTSEQYAALTQGVGRAVGDLRTRLDAFELAIKTLENSRVMPGDALADLVRSEVALQTGSGKPESATKRKATRAPSRSNQLVAELGSTSAD